MIRKYHTNKLQTNPWHHEEEPHNNHETPGLQKKQSSQLSLPHWDVWTGPADDGETQVGLHAWWSTQTRLATLLSSLIARGWVGLQTLWRFRLNDLSIDEMAGPDALAVVWPTGVYLLGFFCSGIQFYLLLSPYLCFISFSYLDSFMQTKHLCVLIHIWTKGEVGAPLNRLKPSSKIFLLTFPRRCFFCESFMLFLSSFVVLSCTSVFWCLVVTCLEKADLLALVCDV